MNGRWKSWFALFRSRRKLSPVVLSDRGNWGIVVALADRAQYGPDGVCEWE